jgi:hypothetical protein
MGRHAAVVLYVLALVAVVVQTPRLIDIYFHKAI